MCQAAKIFKEYMEISFLCEKSPQGLHKLRISKFPFMACDYCGTEFCAFTRETVDRFFEIDIFSAKLDS